MIFQEEHESEAMKSVMVVMDPIIMIYLSIGIVLFTLFAYKRPELRIFIISLVFIWMSTLLMSLHLHDAEAVFIVLAGTSSAVSILYYQYKVQGNKVREGQGA